MGIWRNKGGGGGGVGMGVHLAFWPSWVAWGMREVVRVGNEILRRGNGGKGWVKRSFLRGLVRGGERPGDEDSLRGGTES